MRVVSYLRVSTNEQAKEGVSLSAQARNIAAYINLQQVQGRAFELAEEVADEGFSAKSLQRPGIQRVLELMDAGRVDGLIVAKLDRLTRSLEDWTRLINRYFGGENPKVRLFSVAEEVNTTTANGRMVLNILMTIAQWERETISERTSTGMQECIALGKTTGKLRFGYDLGDDGKTLIENATEQEAIRLMTRMRGTGASLRAIAEALRALGIETKEGNDLWFPSTIKRLIERHPDGVETVNLSA